MNSCALQVDESILQLKRIREAVDEIACIQDKALLSSYGVNYADSSDCDGDYSDSDVEDPTEICTLGIAVLPVPSTDPPPSLEHITLMKQINCNWFEFHQKSSG